jgi:hypothetical protein
MFWHAATGARLETVIATAAVSVPPRASLTV